MTTLDFLTDAGGGAHHLTLGGLWGSSKAYLITLFQQELSVTSVIVTASQKQAEEVYEDLTFFQGLGLLPYPREDIHLYSQWSVAPYEHASPHREIVSERLTVLDKLLNRQQILVVTSVEALVHRTLPRKELHRYSVYIGIGEETERETLTATLVDLGYKHTHLVEERGEFSVRGGIVDIFPSFGANPVRIEFFGDEVESMRFFDPETQRSIEPVELVNILPGKELILSERSCEAAKKNVEAQVANVGASLHSLQNMMTRIEERVFFPGIEWYAPYFHGKLETLLEYLPRDAVIYLDEPFDIQEKSRKFYETATSNYQRTEAKGRLFPAPDKLFLPPDVLESQLADCRQVRLQLLLADSAGFKQDPTKYDVAVKSLDWAYTVAPNEQGVEDKDQHIASTTKRIREWFDENHTIVIASYTEHQAKRVWEILRDYDISARIVSGDDRGGQPFRQGQPEVMVAVGSLNCGFVFEQERLIFLNEDEFLGKQTIRRRHIRRKAVKPQLTLGELELNDFIVHVDKGIGMYLGLKKITVQNITMECLHLEYRGGDKLYVPIDRLDLVQKYKGADQRRPKLDKLGGTSWARVKEKVKASVEKMAEQLLEIYAARQALPGVQFSVDDHLYREFEASFEYEETPDQEKAIEDVARDMDSSRPMDRLVCGDVGYGKTEVAMRAAFRAVLNGKQVAVLVPTTILAQQHYQNFEHRFSQFSVNVGVLSRFKTRKEQAEVVEGVKEGAIDIVIGTHRLLQKDIAFKDLGLVIIDEEQRFGVSHKEKIRQYRKLVDVLTLTATPIPRTLHMSLMGVRDLSIIESPPEGRLAVRTYVARLDDDVIYEAISRELERGGQVFFVHNEVETIEGMALRIRRLFPHITVAVAHGQMKERELETIMWQFINRDVDVLISTTIVESGLDIPSVNTMVINRAHKFGLSQLYQLRGRIGRAKERAYAYLLIPDEKLLSSDARKRLRVIQELSELGSGFKLAAHDLEIRGAGSLLGAEQTGHIAALGFDMYCNIIEHTVSELKGQPLDEEFHPQIDMKVSAHFPEEYIPDMKQRLEAYKRLMSAKGFDKILDIEEEVRDRYGKLPDEAQNIVALAELKMLATQHRVQKIEAFGSTVKLVFDASTPATNSQITRTIKEFETPITRPSPGTLIIEVKGLNKSGKIDRVQKVLSAL